MFLKDIFELVKIRILIFSLFTVVLGYLLALDFQNIDGNFLMWVLSGSACLFSTAAAINHILEIKSDSIMERTSERPMVKKRISFFQFWFLVFSFFILGTFILFLKLIL